MLNRLNHRIRSAVRYSRITKIATPRNETLLQLFKRRCGNVNKLQLNRGLYTPGDYWRNLAIKLYLGLMVRL